MGSKVFNRSMIGIGFGGLVTFIALTIFKIQGIEATVSELWPGTLGSMLVGLYFGWASLIFDYEAWSLLKRTAIHFFLSLVVFFPIAVGGGWIPATSSALLTGLAIFVMIYVVFWFGAILYLKRLADSMNHSIE